VGRFRWAGESLLPLCRDREARGVKHHARCDFLNGNRATMFRMVRDRRWKYVEFPDAPPALFDLREDPGENRNLMRPGGAAPSEAPLDVLRDELRASAGWDELIAMKADDVKRWSAWKRPGLTAPAQYMTADGRVVDADRFLYPGL
jgi:arylsulfatase A-like enzyme